MRVAFTGNMTPNSAVYCRAVQAVISFGRTSTFYCDSTAAGALIRGVLRRLGYNYVAVSTKEALQHAECVIVCVESEKDLPYANAVDKQVKTARRISDASVFSTPKTTLLPPQPSAQIDNGYRRIEDRAIHRTSKQDIIHMDLRPNGGQPWTRI